MSSVPASESTEGAHPLIGATLRGTYRIVGLLDQGGMGMVFEAEHARLRKRLVVKVLARHLVGDAHALARFNHEAEIVSHLQHPNIVQVIDFDTTEQGEPYIVMELLQGESLAARLARERCLSLGEAVRIANQASSGLAAAHQASIVHRDLKPANVFLVNMPGQGTLVKLLDFGISKRGASRGLTGEFDILGTPDYMAPEQALGKTAQVDHRGDQYALAVITYEMLAGRTPFSGEEVMDVLQQVIGKEPEPIEKLAPNVPTAVGDVLRRAMAKDPAARFPSATEFAAALVQAAGTSVPPPNEPLGVNLSEPTPARTPPATPGTPQNPSNKPDGRYQTGLRSRPNDAPANATAETLANSPSAIEVSLALEQARQARGAGDLELAVNFAETALVAADKLKSAEALDALERVGSLVDDIFLARLGKATSRIASVSASRPKKDTGVTPEQAFLLSRVEGGVTLEEVLDLSPMPRQRTLRLLVGMVRQRLIRIEDN
jgi:serine/threonine protein kinase